MIPVILGLALLWSTDAAAAQLLRKPSVLSYSASQSAPPSGVECTMPLTSAIPDERRMELNFAGGGTEMSNSLFIAYAAGPGAGWSLPPLPAGVPPNRRTGYIARFIRHGDGTNEFKIYRNDTGWARELQNDWLPCNPTAALRRVVIRHRKNGEHFITAMFDTGSRFEKTWTFEDDAFPPGHGQRGLQVVAKGHSYRFATTPVIFMDTWTVEDITLPATVLEVKKSKRAALPPPADTSQAWMMYERGDYLSARDICMAILRQDKRSAEALEILGMTEASRADFVEAEKYMARALALWTETLGENHPRVAACLNRLGGVYRTARRYAEAEPVYQRSLAIRQKSFGVEHPAAATALYDLAALYHDQGKFDKAEPLYKQALAIRDKTLQPDHPDVVNSINSLAALYGEMGRYAEAEPLIARWLTVMEKQLGPDHPEIAGRLNKLGASYYMKGRYAEAGPLFRRALAIREKAYGADHLEVAESLGNIGVLEMNLGHLAEAEAMFKRAQAIEEAALGPDHPELANGFENLSILYKKMNRALESDLYAEKVKRLRGK